MKRLLTAFSVAVLMTTSCAMAISAPKTPAQMAATFNVAALDANFPACDARQELRRHNMRATFVPGTPDYFLPRGTQFAIDSPLFTRGQHNKSRALFNAVPQHVKDLAYSQGAIYMFPRHGIVEAVPALRDGDDATGYYNDLGLYIALDRRAYIPFETADIGTAQDGKPYAKSWAPSERDQAHMINHESGHMMDDLLGQYSHDATGSNGDKRLTNRPDYLAAFGADLRELKRRGTSFGWRGYYFPEAYNGVYIGGAQKDEQRARREAFAEMWAEAQGSNLYNLSRFYPRTFQVIKAYSAFLKAETQKHAKCRYGMDGSAGPR
jgi:hypothetical protein